eukprot:GILJ01001226.1.p1 GENE.GILJ01001226.1~~GILJ01001226.1.p1  ORF type:complete len:136 (-),score=2.65 GILJ01001226.1:106-513(-)
MKGSRNLVVILVVLFALSVAANPCASLDCKSCLAKPICMFGSLTSTPGGVCLSKIAQIRITGFTAMHECAVENPAIATAGYHLCRHSDCRSCAADPDCHYGKMIASPTGSCIDRSISVKNPKMQYFESADSCPAV